MHLIARNFEALIMYRSTFTRSLFPQMIKLVRQVLLHQARRILLFDTNFNKLFHKLPPAKASCLCTLIPITVFSRFTPRKDFFCMISITNLVYLLWDNMLRYITYLDLNFSRHYVARWRF